MKASFGFLCLFAGASAVEVTPVQKVVALLGGMLEKGKKQKQDEQVLWAARQQFCGDEQSVKTSAITDEEASIFGETAGINKASADAGRMYRMINTLNADEATWTSDKEAAQSVRKIERADYEETHKDYSESLDAISRAIEILKKQNEDRQQAAAADGSASLMQVRDLQLIPASAKKTIDLFLTHGSEVSLLQGAPEANGYEFQSSGIVEMLWKLQDKFIDERTNLEKEEANNKHSFELLVQSLTAQIAAAEDDETETATTRGATLQTKATTIGDRNEDSTLKLIDSKSLSDLKAMCAMQESDYEARQALRAAEFTEIDKAIEILKSAAVTGNAVKHLPALMQNKKASFGQLRSVSNTKAQDRVVDFLRKRATKFNSRVLAMVAERASADPFQKVKKMLNDLVVRLLDEANEESTHKGWCDTELAANSQTRNEKTDTVQTLQAAIDELDASISKITEKIGDLTAAVAGLTSAMGTETTARNAENKENMATIADAADAQTALAQANTVLREFYSKSAEATSFMQQPYTGMQSENKGVIGMLEVILSDFARLESSTKASEATAQKTYDTFMTDNKVDSASKTTAIEHQTAKRTSEKTALTTKKRDLEQTQTALNAALSYFDKLKPSCVDSGVTYTDRVNRRNEEVQSLKEALQVMDGEAIA